MSVVGLDIGNENCVIAAVKNGGIDVLLNDESKRETPSVVSFGEKQRFLGSAGVASAMMNPKSTISQVKRLIGLSFRRADVENELRLLPFQVSEGGDGGILIHLKYLGETQVFTPVQILAMLMSHLKEITEKNLETNVSDCVIGIPSYFTDLQRRCYLDAAEIAGLKTLRLLHDCTATALGYGIYKNDFPSVGPSFVVFVDIGHCDTQVTVVSFEAGHMKIMAHTFDRCLGGRDFDEVLFNYFAAKFKDEYHIDVYANVRASIRLRAACEKLKKVLSANAEAPLNIECLMDEKDVKGHIKREEFEKLCSSLVDRLRIPCSRVLGNAGLTVDKIYSVELVGSGSRVPAIVKMLSSLFNREPSRTLNASECVARGCALQCAMLSPVYRVRDYEVQDSLPFSIGLSSEEGPICTLSNGILFPSRQPIPSMKVLTLHRSHMFQLEAYYADQTELPPGVSPKISRFMIGPFHITHGGKAKVKVKVQLNLHGIIAMESASLFEDQEDETTTTNTEMVDTDLSTGVSSDIGPKTAGDGIHMHKKSSGITADGINKSSYSTRVVVPVSETVFGGMTKAQLLEAHDRELGLVKQDQLMERTKDRKNELEAYIYEIRNKLSDAYRNFATDSERENISRDLLQTQDWLYEDGDDETEKVYASKMEELKKLVDPVESRYKDEKSRVQATRDLLKCIVDYRTAVKSIDSEEKDAVLKECLKAEQWLRERTQQQDALPKNTEPLLWSSDIRRRAETLEMTCKQLLQSKASPPRSDSNKAPNQPNRTANM